MKKIFVSGILSMSILIASIGGGGLSSNSKNTFILNSEACYNNRFCNCLRGYPLYPKCNSRYTSIVDALKSVGAPSSYSERKTIAYYNGINNYTGSASQNTLMLSLLKRGELIKPFISYR